MRAQGLGFRACLVVGALLGCVVLADEGRAQDSWQKAPAATAKPAPKTGAVPKAAVEPPAAPRTDAQVRQRLEELEKEMVDMHVLVGTLETLARQGGAGGGGGGGYPAAPMTGQEASRISALETQVQALVAQVEQLSNQIRALGAGGGGEPRRPTASGFQKSNPPPAAGGFGSTVVTPGEDPIGSMISGGGAPGKQAALPPPISAGAKGAYESAYSMLLQQDYEGAEAGFTEFLQSYAGDGLAANAQYWLGETYFLRGQWDAAAQAFYKVAQNYGTSVKAPDSLARLAMALDRNGKRPAACAALGELNKRFPNPPAHVKGWEQAERRRTGCS